MTNVPQNVDVRLVWRNDYAPAKLSSAPIEVAAGQLLPEVVARTPNWVGHIRGFALAINGQLSAPVRIAGMSAKPMGAFDIARDRFAEWTAFEATPGTLINGLNGGASIQDLPLPMLLAVTIFAALLCALGALVAAFLVASLPLANLHVALAGYPNLPLAAFYACAAAALLRWDAMRDRGNAALMLALAFACTQIASSGFGWAVTLVPGLIVVLAPRRGLKIAAGILALLLFALAVLAQTSFEVRGHTAHLQFPPAWGALVESYFVLGSWNLLWYAVLAVIPLAGRSLVAPPLAPVTLVAAAGSLFVFALFAFPALTAWRGDRMTLNRATLQFAPVAVIFAVMAFQAFAARWIRLAADRQGVDAR